MNYINPIEILELQTTDIASIDNSIIKKAKRKLLANIDLSDNGSLDYKGIKITRSDCLKVIDELEKDNYIDFYNHLANDQLLNDYLINGNENIFSLNFYYSIYNLPEFTNFISPYFTPRFDKSLLNAFKSGNERLLWEVQKHISFVSTADLNSAYKSLSLELEVRINEVKIITSKIENELDEYSEDNIAELVILIKRLFPHELLNILHDYFQSQINKIGLAINNLQVAIWNEYNSAEVPLNLSKHILELNIESVHKPLYVKHYNLFKKHYDERVEQERNAPTLKKWASILLTIQSYIKSVENKAITAIDAFEKVRQTILISELNALPIFATEIRTQLGYSVRSLSISCWNKQNDIKSALGLINFALQINVEEDARLKFKQDKTELEELEKKYKGIFVCHFCEKNTPDDNSSISQTIYKETYRSYFPRRVQFSYSNVSIPRCKKCKEVHSKGSEKYYLIFFGLLILGAILGGVTEGEHFIIGGIIGAILGWIVGKAVEGNQVSNSGIKDSSWATLSKHPLLIDRMSNGWTFSKPSA